MALPEYVDTATLVVLKMPPNMYPFSMICSIITFSVVTYLLADLLPFPIHFYLCNATTIHL